MPDSIGRENWIARPTSGSRPGAPGPAQAEAKNRRVPKQKRLATYEWQLRGPYALSPLAYFFRSAYSWAGVNALVLRSGWAEDREFVIRYVCASRLVCCRSTSLRSARSKDKVRRLPATKMRIKERMAITAITAIPSFFRFELELLIFMATRTGRDSEEGK